MITQKSEFHITRKQTHFPTPRRIVIADSCFCAVLGNEGCRRRQCATCSREHTLYLFFWEAFAIIRKKKLIEQARERSILRACYSSRFSAFVFLDSALSLQVSVSKFVIQFFDSSDVPKWKFGYAHRLWIRRFGCEPTDLMEAYKAWVRENRQWLSSIESLANVRQKISFLSDRRLASSVNFNSTACFGNNCGIALRARSIPYIFFFSHSHEKGLSDVDAI